MFKPKHIVYATIAFLLGGLNLMLIYGVLLCYFLFCKGFMVTVYYPLFMQIMELHKKITEKTFSDKLKELEEGDSNFARFLRNNKQLVENRLWYLYQTNEEEYNKAIHATSNFAFIIFPIILIQFFMFKKLLRTMRNKLEE